MNSDSFIDVKLTEEGIQQAQELAKQLLDIKFDVICVSELPHTRQTAEFINKGVSLADLRNRQKISWIS